MAMKAGSGVSARRSVAAAAAAWAAWRAVSVFENGVIMKTEIDNNAAKAKA
jgi:hypothetical protein